MAPRKRKGPAVVVNLPPGQEEAWAFDRAADGLQDAQSQIESAIDRVAAEHAELVRSLELHACGVPAQDLDPAALLAAVGALLEVASFGGDVAKVLDAAKTWAAALTPADPGISADD